MTINARVDELIYLDEGLAKDTDYTALNGFNKLMNSLELAEKVSFNKNDTFNFYDMFGDAPSTFDNADELGKYFYDQAEQPAQNPELIKLINSYNRFKFFKTQDKDEQLSFKLPKLVLPITGVGAPEAKYSGFVLLNTNVEIDGVKYSKDRDNKVEENELSVHFTMVPDDLKKNSSLDGVVDMKIDSSSNAN